MAIIQTHKNEQKRGFALLVAVIFMTVMLSLGLALGSLGYKQETLASTAIESQYAFYAADAALECALYYDQQLDSFAYPSPEPATAPTISCDGSPASFTVNYPNGIVSYSSGANPSWVVTERLSLDSGQRCADITVYKYENPQTSMSNITTYVFSQGYDISCSAVANSQTNPQMGTRFASSGLSYHY